MLFLDEPTTGLDPQNRANLWEHLRALRDRGTTIVLTTHYLEEADVLCDRLVIVDHGRIVIEGTPRDLKQRVAGDAIVITLKDESGSAARGLALLRDGALRPGDLRLGRPAPPLRRGRQRGPPPAAPDPRQRARSACGR